MNTLDKEKLINAISCMVPKDGKNIDCNKDSWSFYTGLDCQIRITAKSDAINLSFENYKDKNISVNFDYSEVKFLLEDIFFKIRKCRAEDYLFMKKMMYCDVADDIEHINDYLIKAAPSQINIHDFTVGNKTYSLNFCNIFDDNDKTKSLIYIGKIKTCIDEPGKPFIYIEHCIPGWDMINYKIFDKLPHLERPSDSWSMILDKMKLTNPKMGNFLTSYGLEHDLLQKPACKTHKI